MKRKLLLLWLVLLFVVSVCALTACQHEHVFTDWQTELVPTCTEEGIMFRTCDCGERETKSIPANGHLVGGWTTEEATCTQDGSRVQQCANCGEAVNTEIIPATGHVENPNWIVDKEATCSEKGSRHTKCDNCGETIQTEEIEMVDHVYLFTREVPATCTEQGYYVFTCTKCGDVKNGSYMESMGHQWDFGTFTKYPTCTEMGEKIFTCGICHITKTEPVDANGHNWNDGTVTTAPTCTENGEKTFACKICDATKTEPVDATGHTESDWIVDTAATCTEKGSKHTECSVCGDTITTEEIEKIPHSYTDAVTNPTCTEKGYTTHTCGCGDSYTDTYVDAKGHDWNDGTVTTAPTCMENGEKTFACNDCDATKTGPVAATGHTESDWIVDTVATCSKDGSKHTECTVCGETISNETITAEHTYGEWIEQVDATCTATGAVGHYQCSACGKQFDADKNEIKNVTIPMIDHKFENGECTACHAKERSEGLEYTLRSSGSNKFYYVTGIGSCTDTDIIIPTTYEGYAVDGIDDKAFQNNTTITSVTIRNGLTYIGSYAFSGCTALESVTAPNTVRRIYSYAFQGCTSLESVTLGDYVNSIDGYAFQYCSKLASITFGNSVKTIGANAFQGCSALTSITLGNKLETIGKYTFQRCSSLTSIVIPDSVTSIGESAFEYCTALTSATIGNGVTSIGESAFISCTALTSLTIGSGVTSIGKRAFYNCTALTELNFNATNCADFTSDTIAFETAGANGTGLKVTFGANVQKIPAYLFYVYYTDYANLITGIAFEEGSVCESIGNWAFYKCAALKNVTIPSNITSVGTEAFYNCKALENVYYTGTIDQWAQIEFAGNSANPMYYAGNLHVNGQLVTEINITTATTISDYAFCSLASVERVVIGDSVTSIGQYAFSNCTALTILTIGTGVMSISQGAFSSCRALTEINFNATNCDDLNFDTFSNAGTNGTGVKVTVGANVQKIPASMFAKYSSYSEAAKITEVVFEEGSVCESIGTYAFYDCTTLNSITIPENVKTIGNNAFCCCSGLTEIKYNATNCADFTSSSRVFYKTGQSGNTIKLTIGANVQRIPAYLFYSQNGSSEKERVHIVEIVFEEGTVCQSIGEYAFYLVSELKNVYYGGTIEQWLQISFEGTSSNPVSSSSVNFYVNNRPLTEISLTTLTEIPENAFKGNTTLESVTIGGNVKSIGKNSFSGCSNLASVTFSENSQLTSIDDYAFSGCSSLTSIEIPNGVASIAYRAFSSCSSLTSVILPNSVTSIEEYAFSYCEKLENINIPNSLTNIGRYAFQYCEKLTTVVIPDGMTTISGYAFYGCSGLVSITIPKSLTSLDSESFDGCTSLKTINYTGTEEEWNNMYKDDVFSSDKYTINFNYVAE